MWKGRGWSNITHFESGKAICSQKGVQNRFKGAQFLTVFDSEDKYTDNCVINTTFFESWNWLDWNSDVWSTISFNWGHRRRVARTIAMFKHLRIWMSRMWMRMGGLLAAAILMAICALYYFFTFFLWYLFPERAAQSKSAMIVAFLAVNTLSSAGSAFTVCVFKKGT